MTETEQNSTINALIDKFTANMTTEALNCLNTLNSDKKINYLFALLHGDDERYTDTRLTLLKQEKR